MRASSSKNLGVVTAKILETFVREAQDYDMDGSGECGTLISRGWNRERERIVKEHGFANLQHFTAVVRSRASARWCYRNGI
jgi:hypothetical protein